jgi:hypothetical protein
MPDWLSSLFVHPEFVIPGAMLLSAPIIIHFINRMRFRRVKWAAMEFLLASQRRNSTWVLLKQLLLLLLRIAAIAKSQRATLITFPPRLSVSSIVFFPMLFTETLVVPGSPLYGESVPSNFAT